MSVSLLTTKLHTPRPRVNGVSRTRLTEKLAAAMQRPGSVILLSGSAGFGKTTLLSEFAAGCAGNHICNLSAWIYFGIRAYVVASDHLKLIELCDFIIHSGIMPHVHGTFCELSKSSDADKIIEQV